MLHRNTEPETEPYYCLPIGSLSHWSQPTSPAPGSARTFPLSPTHSTTPRHSIPKNDDGKYIWVNTIEELVFCDVNWKNSFLWVHRSWYHSSEYQSGSGSLARRKFTVNTFLCHFTYKFFLSIFITLNRLQEINQAPLRCTPLVFITCSLILYYILRFCNQLIDLF